MATFSPQTNFSQPPSPVVPLLINGLPKTIGDVPLRTTFDMKAAFTEGNAHGVLLSADQADAFVANAPSLEALNEKYSDPSSLSGKQLAVVGPLPMVEVRNKSYVVVPPSAAGGTIGVGSLNFPFRHDLPPPLLDHRIKRSWSTFSEQATGSKEYFIYTFIGFILLIVISFLVARFMQHKSDKDERELRQEIIVEEKSR